MLYEVDVFLAEEYLIEASTEAEAIARAAELARERVTEQDTVGTPFEVDPAEANEDVYDAVRREEVQA